MIDTINNAPVKNLPLFKIHKNTRQRFFTLYGKNSILDV